MVLIMSFVPSKILNCNFISTPFLAAPGDKQENWILVFSRAQKDQPNNPQNAVYGDNWAATITGLPLLKRQYKTAIKSIFGHCQYIKQAVTGYDPNIPFTRVCVPVRTKPLSLFPLQKSTLRCISVQNPIFSLLPLPFVLHFAECSRSECWIEAH